ncbi:hypothetical protein HMPREF9422_1396 [Streptococcus cristatus ATCC 51100]|uniref:Apea-like HEPN domain-containing protein n=2 Tax=Streptococcus cristatus TaxID=45634 RepID=A0AAV3EGW0_STRCR|nr:hypothetical protein [Streptococcus cristatus]EFX52555.1 hypothetical protein HMPREF9422_1396 [Streptococcus cristatus ATCC 51100]EGU68994.1 hypothetical protein HMPREF9960_0150 [Streptococcus cristatus ATCC 51100]KJQ61709.1 hypothetical protein TZ85_00290 [Streptococcus cristatus]RSJ75660.1 hypothetical protein D8798_08390 [Streptococcus cristatus]SQG31435.1 Uncharacterised protein [Streptococcus cristatus ATCC 51100]
MQFEVKLLTKNISLVKLDELFLSSEIIGIISSDHGEVGDKNVAECSIDYKCSYENDEFTISIQQFRSGIVEISLSYEYSNYKLKAAKKFDKFLSKFREFLGKNHLKYSILSNSLSMYFLNRLYPKFQVYESLLRKIFVLALSPLEDEDIVRIIKEQTNDKLDLSKIHTIEYIERLQIAELHALIFEININPVNDLTIHFKDFQNKNEYILKEMIRNSLPITIWEKHFTPFTNSEKVDVLKNNYDRIREYRNDVMHFHTLTYRRYKKIDLLLSAVIKELEELEHSMLERWDFEATRKLTNDIFDQEFLASLSSLSKTASEVIKTAMDRFYINNIDFNNAIKSMMEVFQNIQVPKIDYGVLKSIKGISDTIGHLGLPTPLNEPDSEEEDEGVF